MKAIDHFYSSVTDCRWFPDNSGIREAGGFTWRINNSMRNIHAADWQASFSEAVASPGNVGGSLSVISNNENSMEEVSLITPIYHPLQISNLSSGW